MAPNARVVRAGRDVWVLTRELVRGDVLRLTTGDVVGADARLLRSTRLQVDESLLTGEALPVDRSAEDVAPERVTALVQEEESPLWLPIAVIANLLLLVAGVYLPVRSDLLRTDPIGPAEFAVAAAAGLLPAALLVLTRAVGHLPAARCLAGRL